MGNLHAQEFAALAASGDVSLETALHYHLRSNHYPPHPVFMIRKAIVAINLILSDAPEALVDVSPASHRRYGQYVPARVVADDLHLWAFVDALAEAREAQA